MRAEPRGLVRTDQQRSVQPSKPFLLLIGPEMQFPEQNLIHPLQFSQLLLAEY